MKLSCSILCAAALLQLAPDAIAGYPNHGVDWAAQRQRWAAGDDPARDLQTKIDAAIASRSPQLTVPAGNYFFGNRTLLIENATDFALLADGLGPVEFVFANAEGGVIIHSCNNVTISGRNATGRAGIHVDRSPPPFAQGTVTKVSDGTSPAEFTLDGDSADPRSLSGDVDPTDYWPNGSSSVMTTGWKKGSRGAPDTRGMPTGSGPFNHNAIVEIAPRKFRCSSKGELSALKVGDQFVSTIWKGFMYNVANSSRVTTEDLAVHATGYMGVYEADGGGGHTYRRFSLVPRNGRIISSNADGIHSEDLDKGPTIIDSHFHSMLDDFMGIHATLLLVQSVETTGSTTKLRIVHPHVSDLNTFGDTEKWYGTSEPLRRVFAGDKLDLFDPLTFAKLGTVTAKTKAVLLSPASAKPWENAISKSADALFPTCCTHFPDFEPEHYKMQHFANSVYEVELTGTPPVLPPPPPPPTGGGCFMEPKGAVNYKYAPGNVFPNDPSHPHGLRLKNSPAECCALCQGLKNCSFFTYSANEAGASPTCYGKPGGCCFLKTAAGGIPAPGCPGCTSGSTTKPLASPLKYVLQIAKTQTAGAVVRNCTFHSSSGFYARWKSSHSVLEGNEWLDTPKHDGGTFELQMLPSYFEGPSHISNVSILNNVFQTSKADATIESILETKAPGAKCCDIEGFTHSGNQLLKPPSH